MILVLAGRGRSTRSAMGQARKEEVKDVEEIEEVEDEATKQ